MGVQKKVTGYRTVDGGDGGKQSKKTFSDVEVKRQCSKASSLKTGHHLLVGPGKQGKP